MVFKEIMPKMNCVECGKMVNEQTVWLDNSGPLCRLCAIKKRAERMGGDRPSANERWYRIDEDTDIGLLQLGPCR